MTRDEACKHVADLITGDRSATHGDAVLQLTNVQQIKAAIGHRDNSKLMLAEIEAIDMIAVKLSRIANGSPIADHFLDIIGYAAIAVEARSTLDPLAGMTGKKLKIRVPKAGEAIYQRAGESDNAFNERTARIAAGRGTDEDFQGP